MLIKTEGIVLHSTRYSDFASIVTIYTRQFGRNAYMVYGKGKKKSIYKPAFFQPFSMVELDVCHSPKKEIQQIKDIKLSFLPQTLFFDPVKNSIALFLSEILFKVLSQAEKDEQLYSFLENSIKILDTMEEGTLNFHLIFLLQLTRFLGFKPNSDNLSKAYFDLLNGTFLSRPPLHSHFLGPELTVDFVLLLKSNYSTMANVLLNHQKRKELLENILQYYQLHISGLSNIQSLEVLEEVFA